ncbi:hypothetical protein HanRHA438_Chr05g0214011 [Helianthus annuus]|nr:hypothetical protein HanRHA438_Chr05g0214011 [Helianthus annuus]
MGSFLLANSVLSKSKKTPHERVVQIIKNQTKGLFSNLTSLSSVQHENLQILRDI